MHRWIVLIAAVLIGGCGPNQEVKEDIVASNFTKQDFPRENAKIFGAWETKAVGRGEQPYRLFFNRKNQIGMEMLCDTEAKVRASSLAGAKIEASTFSVLQELNGSAKNEKGDICTFRWTPFQSMYAVNDEELTIQQGNRTVAFKRLW